MVRFCFQQLVSNLWYTEIQLYIEELPYRKVSLQICNFKCCIFSSCFYRPSCESREPSLQLIDMGRGIDMTLFPEGTTFKTVVTTKDFQCIEMQTKRPWTYQVTI
jgi:hypothetical protein